MLQHLQKLFRHRPEGKPESGGFLVGLFGTPADLVAVRLVERLAGTKPLHLARVVETPRDKCLEEPSSNEESEERKRLRLGRLSHADLQLTCCRNPGKKLLEIANTTQPELLVVALARPVDEQQKGLLRWILKESKFDVLLVEVGCPADVAQPIPSHVVLPLAVGQVWPRPLLAEAARLAGPHGSLEVAGILIVPRSLPLDAALKSEEASLDAAIRDTSLGLTLAGGQVTSRILRARDPQEALCRLRNESLPTKMVLESYDYSLGEVAALSEAQQPNSGITLVRQTRAEP